MAHRTKNLRLSHDGAPYRDALSLSAGERFRFAIEQSFNSKNARRIPHALLDFGFAVFPQLQAKGHIIEDAHVGIERIILEYQRDIAALRWDFAKTRRPNVWMCARK